MAKHQELWVTVAGGALMTWGGVLDGLGRR